MAFDEQRFHVEERKLFDPFYRVRVIDTVAGRRVDLGRGGGLLLGHSSVRRVVKYGIGLYLRKHKD